MRLPIFHIVAVVLTSLFSMSAQADPLALTLEPGNAEGTVQVSLTNTGATTLSVLRWDTPFEEILSSDVFHVERSRKGWPLVDRAAYVGREVKRAEPGVDQYLVLEPGATVSQSVELNDYYRIDKSDTRNVRFDGQILFSELGTSSSMRKSLSTTVLSSSVIESNSVLVNVSPQLSLRVITPAYNSCSIQEQTDIVAATQLAQDYVNTGIADLQSLAVSERSGSPRYTTWFGAYTETRFDRVLSNFVAIGNALEEEQIKFDCSCDESGVYAYVYSSRPYDVFLCPAFRASSLSGTDSRAGTIVHELSHFTILADTDDHVYSQRGAKSLASTDPDKAITNADNHEYFAENTPALEILGTTVSTPVETLALDTPVSGNVALDSSVTYQVSDASQITLSSLTGDADLYLYSDSDLTAESCNSRGPVEADVCEVFADGTVYIRVFGYTEASYTLEATAGDTTTQPVVTFAPLTPNLEVSGSLEAGGRDVYEVSGVELITLESLTGDSDLYIFDSQEFIDSALICASAVSSDESTIDTCTLPAVTDTYYVLVAGDTVSDYSLIATLNPDEPVDVPQTIDKGRLIAGETNSESIASGQYHRFVVAGASSIELTSVTGDADLRVYATADYDESGLLCVSSQNSVVSVVETCDISTGADQYITIFGYEESTYTLIAALVPEEDDPTPGEPVTEEPVTEVPVIEVPVVEEPVVEVPVTEVPVTEEPVAEVPVPEVPVTEEPVAEVPVTEVPVTEEPVAEVPVTEVPVTEEPVAEVPVTEVPVTEEPVAEVPVTEIPVTEEPVTNEPGTDEPGAGVPVTEAPGPDTPVTEAPESPEISDDSPVPVTTPVASSGGSGGGSLNFLALSVLMLTVAYRRSAAKNG